MILVFAFHRTKNYGAVSPFNEIFLTKISLKNRVTVISVRNISLHRRLIYTEDFGTYKVIEVSAFLLPGKYTNFFLKKINYIIAKIIYNVLKKRKLLKGITIVHQIGLFTPIGYYFSNFCNVNFILQLIGNDKYNFESWKIPYRPSLMITTNSKVLSQGIPGNLQTKVIYRGVDLSLHDDWKEPVFFTYNKIFFGGGFPDYRERPDFKRYNYKGGLSLIDIAGKLGGYSITIAGPNCAIGSEYAKKFNHNNIVFLFYLDHLDLLLQLRQTDIVVIPSLDEGIANIAMEAMLAEKLVISRRVGGMPELIQNSQNGLLFNTDHELENILMELMEASRNHKVALFDTMRRNAKITIMKNFDHQNMINQYAELYSRAKKSDYYRQIIEP